MRGSSRYLMHRYTIQTHLNLNRSNNGRIHMTLAALTHGVDPPRVHHTLLRQGQDVGVPDADIDNEGFPFNELF